MSTINFWRENSNYFKNYPSFKNHCSSLRSHFSLDTIFDQFSKHCEELNLFFIISDAVFTRSKLSKWLYVLRPRFLDTSINKAVKKLEYLKAAVTLYYLNNLQLYYSMSKVA